MNTVILYFSFSAGKTIIESTYPALDGTGINIGQLETSRPDGTISDLFGRVTPVGTDPDSGGESQGTIDHATAIAVIAAGFDSDGPYT